jgi:hypothetical protein
MTQHLLSLLRSATWCCTVVLVFNTIFVTGQHEWVIQGPVSGNDLHAVDFTDPSTGVAVGDNGTILITSNGGEVWSPIVAGVAENLYGVAFANEQKVFAVGQSGKVLFSEDQGQNWVSVPGPAVSYDLLGIAFDTQSGRGVMTGQTNAIIVTSDWGITWIIVSDGFMSTFYDAMIVNSDFALVLGWNSIFQPLLGYTLNWVNWDFLNFYPSWGGVMYEGRATGGKFMDTETGFIVGVYFVPGGGFLAPFGGWASNTWDAISFPQPLNGIDLSDSFGVIIGEQGFIAESEDGGNTWNTVYPNIGAVSLNDIHLIGNTGYITGESGTILKMVAITGSQADRQKTAHITATPNPASDKIYLDPGEASTLISVRLCDLQGRNRITEKYRSENNIIVIGVGHLPRGIYLLAIEREHDVLYEKIVLH